jgi:hypothetical protein
MDVGDSALIVGDSGRRVPSDKSSLLPESWRGMLDLSPPERRALGVAARERILQNYGLEGAIVERFETLYREMARRVRD